MKKSLAFSKNAHVFFNCWKIQHATADGPLACVSSEPRRRVLAQAQTRADCNENGYGFSGSATFACRPTRSSSRSAYCHWRCSKRRGTPPREKPPALPLGWVVSFAPHGRLVQPIVRSILGPISRLIGLILSIETMAVFVIVTCLV